MGQSGHAQGRTKSVSAARTTRRTMSRWRGRSTHADVAGVPSQRGRRGGARATCPHMNGFHYATAHVLVGQLPRFEMGRNFWATQTAWSQPLPFRGGP